MPLSPHKHVSKALALGAGLLLGPFVFASMQSERWSILALSLLSILLISGNAPSAPRRNNWPFWIAMLAGILVLAGVGLSTDKLQLLGGVLFLSSALCSKMALSKAPSLAIVACACLIVPLPAAMETELAVTLANLEASLFVTLGQAFDLPVRLFGAQIFYGQSIVTINQDCSGTLLLLPALLGAISAAALSKHKTHAVMAISFAVPMALLINLLRLAVVLGLMASGDYKSADQWHELLGFTALALSWVLPLALFGDLDSVQFRSNTVRAYTQTIALLLVGSIATILPFLGERPGEAPKLALPAYVSGWVAEHMEIPPQESRILNADRVSRLRYTSDNDELLVTAIYHLDSKVGKEHSSERCFRAMGWQVTNLDSQPFREFGLLTFLSVSSGGHHQAVMELEIQDTEKPGDLLRVQIVTRPNLSDSQKRSLVSLFANKILGDVA